MRALATSRRGEVSEVRAVVEVTGNQSIGIAGSSCESVKAAGCWYRLRARGGSVDGGTWATRWISRVILARSMGWAISQKARASRSAWLKLCGTIGRTARASRSYWAMCVRQ